MSQAEMEALQKGNSSHALSINSLKENRCDRCSQETFLQRGPQSQSFNHDFSRVKTEAGTELALSQPGDDFEHEADSIANAMLGQSTSVPSPSLAGKAPQIQRQESPQKSQEEKYNESGKRSLLSHPVVVICQLHPLLGYFFSVLINNMELQNIVRIIGFWCPQ